jgi:phage terminase small subunit
METKKKEAQNKKEVKKSKKEVKQSTPIENESSKKLTLKQIRFAEEYIKDLNATQAYKRAGYKATSDKVASANSNKLLRNYCIKEHIEKLQQQRADIVKVDAQYVLENLIAFIEPGPEFIEVKDRIKCLELIGKHIGMFTDKIEHSGSMNNNVAITSMTPEEREARIQQLLEKAKIIDAH